MFKTAHQQVKILDLLQSQQLAISYIIIVTACVYNSNQVIKMQPSAKSHSNIYYHVIFLAGCKNEKALKSMEISQARK